MKTKLLFISFLFYSSMSYSQGALSSVSAAGSGQATAFLSDYQCLGINPANLGWKRDKAIGHLSIFELGASVYSDALKKKELKQELIFNNSSELTHAQKTDAVEKFTNSKVALNIDAAWLSVAVQTNKIGGFAFTARERTSFSSYFSKDFAEILFEGFNASYFDTINVQNADSFGIASIPRLISDITNGSKVSAMWYREYVLGYGTKVISSENFSMYIGADVKYLSGYGIFDMASENNKIESFSALSPMMEVNFASPAPKPVTGSGMKTVGSGYGFDFGATVELFKKVRLSAAINDIGSIKWVGNTYEITDTSVNNYNNHGFSTLNVIDEIKAIIQDTNAFIWHGVNSRSIGLPTNARIGAYYTFAENSGVGVDCYIPVNNNAGSFEKAIISVGTNITLFKFLTLSLGMGTGGNSGFVIPVGAAISTTGGRWQLGIASRDAITFFTQNNPTVSTAFGFLRFGLGKVKKDPII